jgi:hypothetical protein
MPHDFRRTAVRNLEPAGGAALTRDGDGGRRTEWRRTESIYRRYTSADEAMRKEGAIKLAAFHESEKNGGRKVVPLKRRKAEISKGKR